MNPMEDDDSPPPLLAAIDAPELQAAGVEGPLADLSLLKVPITIVTGN